ncbi:MAG TPA: hypothetical protein VMV15_13520 [Candidatus Binataceae bacterium]|nr:hypothetical protein [Candidatus Binataceae bacterium]HUY20240.1 hypothetical protein [Candidatus Binataceae bacterium]
MGKVIPFKAPRPSPKLVPRSKAAECPKCHHRMDVHVTHPNGSMTCAARGCPCYTPPR